MLHCLALLTSKMSMLKYSKESSRPGRPIILVQFHWLLATMTMNMNIFNNDFFQTTVCHFDNAMSLKQNIMNINFYCIKNLVMNAQRPTMETIQTIKFPPDDIPKKVNITATEIEISEDAIRFIFDKEQG